MQSFVVILENTPSAEQLKEHLNESGLKAVILDKASIENIFKALPDGTTKTVITNSDNFKQLLYFIANYPETEGLVFDEELGKFFVITPGAYETDNTDTEVIQEIIEKEQEMAEVAIPARFIPSKVRSQIFDDFLERIPETSEIIEDHAFLAVVDAVHKLHNKVMESAQRGDNVVEINPADFRPLKDLVENLPSVMDAGVVIAAVIGLLKQTGLTFESIAYLLSALKIPSKFKRGNWNADQVKYYYRVLRTKLDLQSLNDMFFSNRN